MSVLAKTLVIVNLILATIFFSVTATVYPHRKHWKTYWKNLKDPYFNNVKETKDTRGRLEQLVELKDKRITSLEDVLKVKKEERISLQKTLTDQNRNLVELEEKMEKLLSAHQLLAQEINKVIGIEQILRSEIENLLDELHRALKELEIADNEVARLIEEKDFFQHDLDDMKREYQKIRSELKEAIWVLRILNEKLGKETIERLVVGKPAPTIKAKVLHVAPDVPFVMLSVGEDDKVKIGYEFTIWRGNKFIATVIVQKVLKDTCVANIKFKKEKIEEGDNAATHPEW